MKGMRRASKIASDVAVLGLDVADVLDKRLLVCLQQMLVSALETLAEAVRTMPA